MACFIVPAVEAVAVGIASKATKKAENITHETHEVEEIKGLSLSQKLSILTKLLIGGAVLLMFEHVWHGEVVPFFPFLTAMNDPEDALSMVHEMATVGSTMCLIVTGAWAGICVTADSLVKRAKKRLAKTM